MKTNLLGQTTNGMELRRAEYADWKDLLMWRNDSLTRKNCRVDDFVNEIEHKKWLENAIKNESLILLIATEKNVSIGTIRGELDHETEIYKVSWTIAPNYRNKGSGKKMALLFIENYTDQIRVEIKMEDTFSVKIAEHIGLSFRKNSNGILHYSY